MLSVKPIVIRISNENLDRLDVIAKAQGSNRSAVIRMAIIHLLKVYETTPDPMLAARILTFPETPKAPQN